MKCQVVVDKVDGVTIQLLKRMYFYLMNKEMETSAYVVLEDHFELLFPQVSICRELPIIYQSLQSISQQQQQQQESKVESLQQIVPCIHRILQQQQQQHDNDNTMILLLLWNTTVVTNRQFVQSLHQIVVQHPHLRLELVIGMDMNSYFDNILVMEQHPRMNISRCLSSVEGMNKVIMERLYLVFHSNLKMKIEMQNIFSFECDALCDLFHDILQFWDNKCKCHRYPIQTICGVTGKPICREVATNNNITCHVKGQVLIQELNELYTVGNPVVLLNGRGEQWRSIIKNETLLVGEVNYDFERREFLNQKNLVLLMPNIQSDTILMKRFMTKNDVKHIFTTCESHENVTPLAIPLISCDELPSTWKQFDSVMMEQINSQQVNSVPQQQVGKSQPNQLFKNRVPLVRKFK